MKSCSGQILLPYTSLIYRLNIYTFTCQLHHYRKLMFAAFYSLYLLVLPILVHKLNQQPWGTPHKTSLINHILRYQSLAQFQQRFTQLDLQANLARQALHRRMGRQSSRQSSTSCFQPTQPVPFLHLMGLSSTPIPVDRLRGLIAPYQYVMRQPCPNQLDSTLI